MVETNWTPRKEMINYIAELQDEDNIVCNEDGEIIYIFADKWMPIALTQWQPRE